MNIDRVGNISLGSLNEEKVRRRNWRGLWHMWFLRGFWGLEHGVVIVGLVPFLGKGQSSGHRNG